MTVLRAKAKQPVIGVSKPPFSGWASQILDVVLLVYVLAIAVSIIGGMMELLVVLSLGIGPIVGVVMIGKDAVQTARQRRWRVLIDAGLDRVVGTIREGDISLFDRTVFREARILLKEVSAPTLRAGIRLLRHAATLSTQEQIRPRVLENRRLQIQLLTTVRDMQTELRYGDLLRAFEAIGKLIALEYYAIGQDEETEVDLATTSDAKITSFLKQAAKAIYEEDLGPPLRALKALLLGIKRLYSEEESAIPMLVLSWSYLRVLGLLDSPALRDSPLWASKYEQTALLTLEMAEAFERRQLSRIVELIGESYDPSRHVLKFTARRRFRALSANVYH